MSFIPYAAQPWKLRQCKSASEAAEEHGEMTATPQVGFHNKTTELLKQIAIDHNIAEQEARLSSKGILLNSPNP